jgi:hypothetical protein
MTFQSTKQVLTHFSHTMLPCYSDQLLANAYTPACKSHLNLKKEKKNPRFSSIMTSAEKHDQSLNMENLKRNKDPFESKTY